MRFSHIEFDQKAKQDRLYFQEKMENLEQNDKRFTRITKI